MKRWLSTKYKSKYKLETVAPRDQLLTDPGRMEGTGDACV
jgi:hypothetical protein